MGGAALTGYRVEALTSAKRGARVAGSCTTTPKVRTCTIKGLEEGPRLLDVGLRGEPGWGHVGGPRKKVRVR